MRELSVEELAMGLQTRAVYHQSGELLIASGETLTEGMLNALRRAGIEHVFEFAPGEDSSGFIVNRRFESVDLMQLAGRRLTTAVLGTKGVVLIRAGEKLGREQADQIVEECGPRAFVERPEAETKLSQVRKFFQSVSSPRLIGDAARRMLKLHAAARPTAAPKEKVSKETGVIPRRFARYEVVFPARFKIRRKNIPAEDRPVLEGEVVNISRGGLMIRCAPDLLAESDIVDLIFRSPDGIAHNFTVRVQRITHLDGGAVEVGTRFLSGGDEDAEE